MSFLKLVGTTFLLLALSGCANKLTVIKPEKVIGRKSSEINKTITARIGEEVIGIHEYELIPAIDLRESITAGGGLKVTCTVPPQRLLAYMEDEDWTYFRGANVILDEGILGSTNTMGGIKIPKSKSASEKPAVFCRHNIATLHPDSDEVPFEAFVYRRPTSSGIQQSLVYSGRDEQTLYFTYKQQSKFGEVQESILEHDIEDGTTISAGSAEIRIQSSTGSSIRYQVLKHF